MSVILARPDGKKIQGWSLNDDKWTKIYQRQNSNVDSVSIRNVSSQPINVSPESNPSGDNFDIILPGQTTNEDFDPDEIWCQRTLNSPAKLKVTVRYFTPKALSRASTSQ